MSDTTKTLHVRGVLRARFLDAVIQRMRSVGFVSVEKGKRKLIEATDPHLRRLALRRDGRWLTLADADGDADIETWEEYVSRALGRSVLTIWTWDGEATVVATRWRNGTSRGVLTLLDEAYCGPDGLPYAPAKTFRPWLAPEQRDAVLASGIKLVAPSGGSTGDAELDAVLEGFDDVDRVETASDEDDEDATVFVDLDVSVAAIGAAVGLARPMLNPRMLDEGDEELLFRPAGPR